MRRLALIALLLATGLAVGAPAPFTKTARPDRRPSEAQLREKRRVSVTFVCTGMTELQLTALLGHPSRRFALQDRRSASVYDDVGLRVFFTPEGVVEEILARSVR